MDKFVLDSYGMTNSLNIFEWLNEWLQPLAPIETTSFFFNGLEKSVGEKDTVDSGNSF